MHFHGLLKEQNSLKVSSESDKNCKSYAERRFFKLLRKTSLKFLRYFVCKVKN